MMVGCSGASNMFSSDLLSKDAEWFSRPGRLFIKNISIETPPLTPDKAVAALEHYGGTVIKTSLPKSARKWAYVTHFDMKLQRRYVYQGQHYSYVNAGCAAPEGFPGAVYKFAKSNFGFAGGNHVMTTLVRDCTVK